MARAITSHSVLLQHRQHIFHNKEETRKQLIDNLKGKKGMKIVSEKIKKGDRLLGWSKQQGIKGEKRGA